jgi:hypothetical protein
VLYLAEFYLPGSVRPADVADLARAGAAQAAQAGADVSLVQVIVVPQDESCFAIYRAGSADAVTVAGTLAGLVFDRVVAAVSVA